MIYKFSLKVGKKFGMWQYKVKGTHDKTLLVHMRFILNKTCQLLGYDHTNREQIYLFSISAEPFEGYQLALSKIEEKWDDEEGFGCVYTVFDSKMSEQFRAEGLFPYFIKRNYLKEWPEKIYIKLETISNQGIIS